MGHHAPRVGTSLLLTILLWSFSIQWSTANPTSPETPLRAAYDFARDNHRDLQFSFRIDLVKTAPKQDDLPVYFLAGRLEDLFDNPQHRPDAVILPTNAGLDLSKAFPTTQKRVLAPRLEVSPPDFNRVQAEMRACVSERKSKRLELATDFCGIHLQSDPSGPLKMPALACLIATDEPGGGSGAMEQRDLYTQARVAQGIEKCLRWLDEQKARSVVLPQIGAASGWTGESHIPGLGKRNLLQCRLLNSIAGIGLGIAKGAANLTSLREIALVQYDDDFRKQLEDVPAEQRDKAYRIYANQAETAWVRALRGEGVEAKDLDIDQNCNVLFGFPLTAPPKATH